MRKSYFKRVLAIILTTVVFALFSQPIVEAAATKFISEVVLAYGNTDSEAKQKLKDAGYTVYPKNLNADALKNGNPGPCVYLGYKTSNDVEDAITDFSVMNMHGNYRTGCYDTMLTKSYEKYLSLAEEYKTAAVEFSSNYNAGDVMAQSAYSQMNFCIDDDTQLLLGDFMMNIPGDDALATVLLQGNVNIVDNIGSLLAMGVSGANRESFISAIEQNSRTPGMFTDSSYYEDAKAIADKFEVIASRLAEYESISKSGELDKYGLRYADTAALYENIRNISYGQTTLLEFIKAQNWEVKDFYPLVAAMTSGQRALVRLGYIEELFIYSANQETALEYQNFLAQQKNNYPDALSVYFGIDRSVFDGNWALTADALRYTSTNGDSFWNTIAADNSADSSMFVFGLGSAETIFALNELSELSPELDSIVEKYMEVETEMEKADSFEEIVGVLEDTAFVLLDYEWSNFLDTVLEELDDLTSSSFFSSVWGITSGVLMIMDAIDEGIAYWEYYHPEYKEIPDTVVDLAETDKGSYYVKYSAVMNVETDPDGGTVPGDINGFFAKEWNALYVTKDYRAGRPLTAVKINYSNSNEQPGKGYSPVHLFGEDVSYNLNLHQYNEAVPVYLSFRQSNEKKAAESNLAATNISYGIFILTGGGGIAVGMGIMGIISRIRKKSRKCNNKTCK